MQRLINADKLLEQLEDYAGGYLMTISEFINLIGFQDIAGYVPEKDYDVIWKSGMSRPIYKIDYNGNIINKYPNISSAAKDNELSYRTIYNRLHRKHLGTDMRFKYVYIDEYEKKKQT